MEHIRKGLQRYVAVVTLLIFCLTISVSGGEYIIQKGDTLGAIAKKYGISVEDIKKANGLSSDRITAGKTLIIPEAGASSNTQEVSPNISNNNASVPVMATANMSIEKNTDETHETVTLEFRNTDIRDILNVLAKFAKKRILYIGEPQKIDLTASVVSFVKVLNLIKEQSNNLNYLVDDDVYIIGPADKVQNTFLFEVISSKIALNNLSAKELIDITDSIGIDTQSVKVSDKNPNIMLIEATPKNIAYAMIAARLIDKKENFTTDETGKQTLNKTEFTFKNIDAMDFETALEKLEIKASVILRPNDKSYAMVVGDKYAVSDVQNIYNIIEKREETDTAKIEISKFTPSNNKAKDIFERFNAQNTSGAQAILQSGDEPKDIYLIGTELECSKGLNILKGLDINN